MPNPELTRKIGYFDSSSGGRGRMGSRARPPACYLMGRLSYYNGVVAARVALRLFWGYHIGVMYSNLAAFRLAAAAILAVAVVCLLAVLIGVYSA